MTVPGDVRLARHIGDIDDDGHHAGTSIEGSGDYDVTPLLTQVMPAWVKPSGTGLITNDAQGKLTIDTGSGDYRAFPDMVLVDGVLHLVYRKSTDHATTLDGLILYRTSRNLGRTWSSSATIWDPTGAHSAAEPYIVYHSSGRLVVAGTSEPDTSGAGRTLWVFWSDDFGASWTTPVQITTHPYGSLPVVGHMVELPDGTLIMGTYGKVGADTQYSSYAMFSTDRGETWGDPVLIADGQAASRMYGEPWMELLSTGKLVCLIRSDTTQHIYRSYSLDFGQTWSTVTDVLALQGRPNFCEFYPGALYLQARNNITDNDPRWTVSWDEGATWETPAEVDTGVTTNQLYASPTLLTAGYIAVPYALENSSTDADVFLRYYHDGYGIDPLGNISGLTVTPGGSFATPAIVLGTAAAAGAASTVIRSDSTIVAFDATAPTTQAFSDSAATGSAAVAARRDHKHGMPASPSVSGGTLVIASSHSTPLVFGDLVQTSDGSDLIYSSS